MAKKRIYVPVTDAEYALIKDLAEADKRSIADKAHQILTFGIDEVMKGIKNKITIHSEEVGIKPIQS